MAEPMKKGRVSKVTRSGRPGNAHRGPQGGPVTSVRTRRPRPQRSPSAGRPRSNLWSSFAEHSLIRSCSWHRVFAWDRREQLPDSAPVTLEEIRDVMRRALGTDFGLQEARWISRFHSDERQAAQYRVGRVFLAGDAAHVHSPAGGQGMNTGLPAGNLGWKLAAATQGWAGDGLLDTYESERHPVGRLVLRSSGRSRGSVVRCPM